MLLAAVLFGTTGTVLTGAPATASALGVGAVRLVVGGPLLLLAGWSATRGSVDRPLPALRRVGPSAVAGGAGAAAFQLLYFVSTTRTGVAVGTVVTIGSGPMFSGIIHAVVARHRPGRGWAIGTVLGVVGVCLLTATGPGEAVGVDALGLVAGLGAGLGWAAFATLSKWQIERGVNGTVSLGAMFTIAAVLCSPLLALEPMDWLASGRGLVVALYLGVCTLTVAYVLYGRALTALPAPEVITLTLLEPVTAALLASAVVGESISATGWFGIGLVLVGLLVTARQATIVEIHRPASLA